MLKVYDEFLEDETILALKHTSYRVHVSALIYCAKNLTDGEVTEKALKVLQLILGFTVRRHVPDLVEAGLWIPQMGGGWRIKNYLEFNPSAEQVKKERTAARKRMRELREKRVSSPEHATERSPAVPSPSFSKPLGVSDLSALPRDVTAGHDEILWRRLCVAAGARTAQDIGKLERTVRARKSTEREITCAIEAATGPGVNDPLAVALAELVKRHGERNAA